MPTNKSLVAMASEISLIEQTLINSSGEITPELEELLNCKDLELPEKVDGYAFRYSRLEALEAWYKSRAAEFDKMTSGYKKAKEQLKANAKIAMELLGADELVGVDYKLKMQNTKGSVIIKEPHRVDPKYMTTEITTKIDKDAIYADLKAGVKVDGVELESGGALKVYANGGK